MIKLGLSRRNKRTRDKGRPVLTIGEGKGKRVFHLSDEEVEQLANSAVRLTKAVSIKAGDIDGHKGQCLEIQVPGFKGDSGDPPTQIMVEFYEGKLRVHVWDGSSEDYCQTIRIPRARKKATVITEDDFMDEDDRLPIDSED